MESYIQISKINDFIFCPYSLYLHSIYENVDESLYHQDPQVTGKLLHKPIDTQKYSTKRNVLQGVEVYSEKYQLAGKIDLYYQDKKKLVERKTKVAKIYNGYKYQLYAQYFALEEMGYEVTALQIRSLLDNKVYDIPLPDFKETIIFEAVIKSIRDFHVTSSYRQNPHKCTCCIYTNLCPINHYAFTTGLQGERDSLCKRS